MSAADLVAWPRYSNLDLALWRSLEIQRRCIGHPLLLSLWLS